MLRRILWLLPIVLLAIHAFWGVGPSDYETGYEQAIRDLERAHEELGRASEIGESVVGRIQYLPVNPSQSEQWKVGYRQALKDQFERPLR